jgi:hypothetical protein
MRKSSLSQLQPLVSALVAVTLTANTWLVMHSDFTRFSLRFLGSEIRIEKEVSHN